MKDYLLMQLDYLLSRVNIFIMYFLLAVLIISSIYNSQIFEGYEYIDGFRREFAFDFLNESFIVIEFIMVFISIYIGIILAGKNNQSLMKYTVVSLKTKKYHIISRIIVGMGLILLLIIFIGISLIFITMILTPYPINTEYFIKLLALLYLELIQYFMMSMILMAFVNHFLFGILPMLIFWLLEIITYDIPKNIKNIIDHIMININGYQIQEKNILISLILFHFFTISYIIVLQKKDC
ncbi:hypothetical protein KHQ88_03960 [Mycoplasmatota bacterium]|nr:hypothetical protein KHQ88_03960 [Mycoplasmatota bacterium]